MHIVISGGSGFVGKALQRKLLNEDHHVTILSRNPGRIQETEKLKGIEWLSPESRPEERLSDVDAIVNLAGESINGLRWTKTKKERIVKSRMEATGEIIRLIEMMENRPEVLVNASAVGYYGMSETEIYIDESKSAASDFLAGTVRDWEQKAAAASGLGVRTVFTRFGIILGKEGALPLMALPYKLGVGGTIGSGNPWETWIHVEDVAGMIKFAIEDPEIKGPLNVTAPEPVKMKEFGKTLGSVIGRPHWLPVPKALLKMGLGEMSSMLTEGQRVFPEKAMEHGYSHSYPKLDQALNNIFNEQSLVNS